jgi:hypothetical protein
MLLKQLNGGFVAVESLHSHQIIGDSDEWVFVSALLGVIEYVGK